MTIKILDISHRLPGPLAAHVLATEGYDVTRCELKADPFDTSDQKIFNTWYRQLNSNKKIESFESINVSDFDVIIKSPKIKLDIEDALIIDIQGSRNETPLHDLNVIGMTSSFAQYSNGEIPFLPFAGICFAQKIVIKILTLLNKNISGTHNIYLEDISGLFDILSFEDGSFLHNGAYPCYQVYNTQDNQLVTLCAVEEEFWVNFCNNFDLSLKKDDRFDTTGKIIIKLTEMFNNLTLSEVTKLNKAECCLTWPTKR